MNKTLENCKQYVKLKVIKNVENENEKLNINPLTAKLQYLVISEEYHRSIWSKNSTNPVY